MPLQATSGAASYDAFGGGVVAEPNYIESCFSTYLYTGNSGTQTITNGIDLSTKGGLVWIKQRASDRGHVLVDTVRGATKFLTTCNSAAVGNATDAEGTDTARVPSFTTSGFTLGADSATNSGSMVSWTFRKQPKFFDIVTYTGNGSSKTINHNLGSVPGVMIVKSTTYVDNWAVYHRSLGATKYIELNNTDAASTSVGSRWDAEPTSTSFSVGYNGSVNASGETYVAYLFAHDAGGFGLSGTDNVISCGSYTGNGTAGNAVTLGFEPQWIMIKKTSSAGGGWVIQDVMRGMSNTGSVALSAQSSGDEADYGLSTIIPTATGFTLPSYGGWNGSGETFIYIAIRRGPMKVPTTGTSVFAPIARTGTSSSNTAVTAGFPVDAAFIKASSTVKPWDVEDRLRGGGKYLEFQSTAAEVAGSPAATINFTASNTGVLLGTDSYVNSSANSYANYFLQRAPSFFDEVCYTGTGAAQTLTHNLAAVPELMISRRRDAVAGWAVYSATLGATKYMRLQTDDAPSTGTTLWNDTAPTSTQFTLGSTQSASSGTYVQYLFATCAGVSKVGSYTGNGSSQTINCGFTGGSRFVLIKKTSGTGDWMISDSARGIVSGSDPYLELNNTNAEVTGEDWLDTDSTGFVVNEVSGSNANTNGATYIFLAIA